MLKRLFKKGLVVGITFLVVVGFSSISGIQIDKNLVNPSYKGDTLYVGGSGEGNYTTIQSAVDDAVDGDTVFVFDDSSPYYERVFINTSINLIGEDRNTTVIEKYGIRIQRDRVNICGFSLQKGEVGVGIIVRGFHNITIYENNFIGGSYGITLDDSSYNSIYDNCFNLDSSYVCIKLEGRCCNNKIFRNVMQNTGQFGLGICSYDDFSNNKITQNVFKNNLGGIILNGENNIISNNIFESNRKYGISLNGENNIISYNHFESNIKYGIYVHDTLFNYITCNNFIDNGCIVTKRHYYPFMFLTMFPTIFSKQVDSNYWDTYTGNGIKSITCFAILILPSDDPWYPKEVPIRWFSFDWHPAKEPYDITTTQGCDIE